MKRIFLTITILLTVSIFSYARNLNKAEKIFAEAIQEYNLNHFEEALKLFLDAERIYQDQGLVNTPEYAEVLHSAGKAYYNIDNYSQGRYYSRRAYELREKLFGKVSEPYIISLNNYALSYLLNNELEEALKYQTEVIDLCKKMSAPNPNEGMYLINLGRIYDAMGDDETAIQCMVEAFPKVEEFSTNYEFIRLFMEKALTTVEKHSDNYAKTLDFLGNIYYETNDIPNLNRIMELSQEYYLHELNKPCSTPECHFEKAEIYMTMGESANAKNEFMSVFAMPLTEEQKANAYLQYAIFLSSENDNAQAEENFKMAIELFEKLGMKDEAHQALEELRISKDVSLKLQNAIKKLEDLGGKYEDLSELPLTERHEALIQSGLNELEKGGDYFGKISNARTMANIAGSYAYLNKYDKAIEYYEQYINTLRKALAEDFLLKNPRERENTWKKELYYINLINSLIGEVPEDSDELYLRASNLIYNAQLLAKGILLSSNVEFDKVLNRYGTTEMKKQYQEIKNNLLEIEKMRQNHSDIEEIQSLVRKTDALQLSLSKESATKGIFTDFLKYTAGDIYSTLNQDEAAIEFLTIDSGISWENNFIIGVVLSKDYPFAVAIPICTNKDVQHIIGDKDKFTNEEYTSLLWGPILQLIPGKKKIYFAPDGVLNNIGIEYFSFNGSPINETIEMSRLSSTREICRPHSSPELKYAALFGNIDYMGAPAKVSNKNKYSNRSTRESDGYNFGTLEATAREIKEITKTLKGSKNNPHIFSYTQNKASKAELLSQDELPINLLHIATHGKYSDETDLSDSDAMKRSILAFTGANMSDIGIVSAAEIADMSLPDCDLVVLSACESGIGKLSTDGVFGLQRGFKNAGVKTLLVSLKEVYDDSTADMMIAFYNHLINSGKTKQEALKLAQSEIRKKYPDDDTWASFILIDSFN